ncbi:ABC transporter substrate-binding protein [Paenibacillus naphthalenovorans]|uniref:ABC transporter substrate-binding protein n=1 Tax=Paenibacillus naphthalenovorans TaxID=162209 RepID=UPI0010FA0D70|nr:ABC transporter substrate-binding protein [Paenibacillus naphthalenovorans]
MRNAVRKAGKHGPAFFLLLMMAMLLAGCFQNSSPRSSSRPPVDPNVFRIGYTPNSMLLAVMKKGDLESRLTEKHHVGLEWVLYEDDVSLFQAIEAGQVDLGSVGEAVPAFLHDPDTPIVYLAAEPSNPAAYAVIVPLDSTIFQAGDLKGKKVAFAPKTNEHLLLLQVLEEAGLSMKDIKPNSELGQELLDAYSSHKADAWVISEPLISQLEPQGIRIVVDATGKIGTRDIYIAASDRYAQREEIYKSALQMIQRHGEWTMTNIHDAADILTEHTDIEHLMWLSSFERKAYGTAPFLDSIVSGQQKLYDYLASKKERAGTLNVKEMVP